MNEVFIIEDNNQIFKASGIIWQGCRMGKSFTRRHWLSIETLQAMSHKGLSVVAVAVKKALAAEKEGDPGASFKDHGQRTRGARQFFGSAMHRHQPDQWSDQSLVGSGFITDDLGN